MITQGRLIYSPHCADGALEKARHAQVSDVPKSSMSESFNDETGAGAIADLRCGTPELTQRGTECEFAAFAQETAFVHFADLHFGLQTSCTPTEAMT